MTALFQASPFTGDSYGFYGGNKDEVNEWITTHHGDNQFSLHRACSSYNPLDEVIFDIVKKQGQKAFKIPDRIGVTASKYLSKNPFADIEEEKILKRFILDMMGEIV